MGLLGTKIRTVVIVLCCLQVISKAQKHETFSEQYGPFNLTYYDFFEVAKPAIINNGALQLTPDSASQYFDLANNSGRVFLRRPFRLWEGDSGGVASFNSSFLINIYRPNNATPGGGLAFLIAPDLQLPANSYGEYLGLTNATIDDKSANKVIAIELDTFKHDYDIDDNHVGLDINGIRSVKYEPLSRHGITLAPVGVKFHNIWVQYDGGEKSIEVYIAEQASMDSPTPPRPSSPLLTYELDLRKYLNDSSYFGFTGSTGNTGQLNSVLRWNLTVQTYYQENKQENKLQKKHEKRRGSLNIVLPAAGVPVLLLLLIGAVRFGFYFHQRPMDSSIQVALKTLPGNPREFNFRELKKATNNFDEKNKLGQGGFGVVYKGLLANDSSDIAVKCFLRKSIKGQDDFLAELSIINRLRHKHLVRLLGWCHKNGKLLLVYEYMPKGSLDRHLFVEPDMQPLGWNLRYNIISGVASALHYLHNEYDQRVVHRDLKASNIMLDSNFNARLGDFGLARALDNGKTSNLEGIAGTMGYIAPECFLTGKATELSDVYAFGAVVLEVVCGRRPGARIDGFNYLVDWVWYLYQNDRILKAIDERLGEDYNAEEAGRLLLLGLACSHPTASKRPKMQTIVQIISGSVPPPSVPPLKPAFVWPAMMPRDAGSSTPDSAASITITLLNSGR